MTEIKCPCGKEFEKESLELHLIEYHYINGDFSPILTEYIIEKEESIPKEMFDDLLKEQKSLYKKIESLISNFHENGKDLGMDTCNYSYSDIIRILKVNLLSANIA